MSVTIPALCAGTRSHSPECRVAEDDIGKFVELIVRHVQVLERRQKHLRQRLQVIAAYWDCEQTLAVQVD